MLNIQKGRDVAVTNPPILFHRAGLITRLWYNMMKLTKQEREQYEKCLGQCTTCLLDGECKLQEKLKGEKDENDDQTVS